MYVFHVCRCLLRSAFHVCRSLLRSLFHGCNSLLHRSRLSLLQVALASKCQSFFHLGSFFNVWQPRQAAGAHHRWNTSLFHIHMYCVSRCSILMMQDTEYSCIVYLYVDHTYVWSIEMEYTCDVVNLRRMLCLLICRQYRYVVYRDVVYLWCRVYLWCGKLNTDALSIDM